MSASAFYSLVDTPVASGSGGSGSDTTLAARTLEARKQGGGPTAALGLGGGAAVYADQYKITAADGLIVSPLFVLPSVAAAGDVTLDVTKSGATYFLQGDTADGYANTVTLRLPALSATRAGFKARFRIVSEALGGTKNIVIQQNDTGLDAQLVGFISSRAKIPAGAIAAGGLNVVTTIGTKSLGFIHGQAVVGDWVEVESDGATWHVTGSAPDLETGINAV